MHEIVIATQNPGKVAELRALLADLPVEVLGLGNLGISLPEPEETGSTFEENAAIKALAYSAWTGKACLADDSGLEVDALAGAPGVNSAWYAYTSEAEAKALPREIRDPANNALLLDQLDSVPLGLRSARFVCCMALAHDDRILATSRGTFDGRIGIPPRVPAGDHGFGYDPIFLVGPEYAFASAELEPRHKNQLSHRAAAAREIARQFRTLAGH